MPKPISPNLIDYFSALSLPTLMPLFAKHRATFSETQKSCILDLNWLYSQDSFLITFCEDEEGYPYTKEKNVSHRLKQYDRHFSAFNQKEINLDNVGEFILFYLQQHGEDLETFEKQITSMLEAELLSTSHGIKNKIL